MKTACKRRAASVVWLLGYWVVTPLMAAMITVNDTSGTTGGPGCTLRDAITAANTDAATGGCSAGSGADTIVLPTNATITLTVTDNTTDGANGLPSITSVITVRGNGTTIERSGLLPCNLNGTTDPGEFRIFHVGSAGDLTLDTVTVRNGCADAPSIPASSGGGILNWGTIAITNSTISGHLALNDAALGTGGTAAITNSTISGNFANFVGGVANGGTVTITNSAISGNSANVLAGGIWNGLSGTATIINSTISGNLAPAGGGIVNLGLLNASFVTIASNDAGASGLGGGIFNRSPGTVNIKNSMVGDNSAGGGGPNCQNFGTISPSGVNLATDASCGGGFTVVSSAALNLGPLANNGGPTQTHALQTGSAAIDAVTDCTDLANASVAADQRGVSRPQGSRCDVGAYELFRAGVAPVPVVLPWGQWGLLTLLALTGIRALRRRGREHGAAKG